MSFTFSSDLISRRRKPLAVCVTTIFALATPGLALAANTWLVSSCDEGNSGDIPTRTGTLRFAVANAASGDTVNLSELPTTYGCSTITLKTGAINIAQTSLILQGPGIDSLTITGQYTKNTVKYNEHDRIFNHTGTGSVGIYDLSVSKGYLKDSSGTANGGCIYSKGTAILKHVGAYGCSTHTDTGMATGGAIYTANGLTLKYSNLTFNTADGGDAGSAYGGGARSKGAFFGKYDSISLNFAQGATGNETGFGAGLFLNGNATITSSTISGNSSDRNGGGVQIFNQSPASLITIITNSTISGNYATSVVGGVYSNSGTVRIRNSTIAFNTTGSGTINGYYFGPGLSLSALYGAIAVTLQSTLISNNTYGTDPFTRENDLSTGVIGYSLTFNAAPANNLVRVTDFFQTYSLLPTDTIFSSCPRLGQLRDNGGLTQTHALLSHSAAIDKGNNSVGLNEDQRGVLMDSAPYPYPRVLGSAADIGAYEVNQDDVVFNNDFEGCLPPPT